MSEQNMDASDTQHMNQLIRQILNEQLRIGEGVDFHSLYDGYPLTLAGVIVPHDRGFRVKRSDGDPISHALVDALLAALGEGDIADWFSDQDGITNARSIEYLGVLHKKLLLLRNISIVSVQVTILAEQPKLKSFFPLMRQEIATQLEIDRHRVSITGKTFEGKGIIGQQQGIETRALVMLLEGK